MKDNADFALIGWPLGPSFSAAFFPDYFDRDGSGRLYVNHPIERLDPASMKDFLESHPSLKGFNVTAPHKETVMQFVRPSELASRVGAVNTVKVLHRGDDVELYGHNTDVEGFRSAIGPMLDASDRHALVLGTGGASKAAVAALEDMGLKVRRVSRSGRYGSAGYDELPELLKEATVLVNATPVGTWPNVDAAPDIPYDCLTADHKCFDMVYNPERTRFMELACERGAAVQNGYRMLVGQALAALRIWES